MSVPDISARPMSRARRSAGPASAKNDLPDPRPSMRVKLVMRRPLPGQFSVERVFRDVAGALPADIDASLVEVPYRSQGILPRLGNMLFTARLRADVVHITGDIQYCALAVRSSRCVLTVLDLVSVRRLSGWRKRILSMIWYRLPVRHAAAITTISTTIRDELLDGFPTAAHKTSVIGCPVSDHFQPAPASGLGSNEFRVLQVGTGPNKNLERVATAIVGLPVHLHVVGRITDEQRHVMERLGLSYSEDADLSDSDMRCAYQTSNLLIFASTYEGFGLPIVEAQACGLPVVTSAIPPMCDIAGDAAVLVDPHDAASIRSGVVAVLRDASLRSGLSQFGPLNAARHSPTRVAAEYADTYRRVVTRKLL